MKSYKQFIKESEVLSKTDKDFIHSKLYHKIIFHGISNNYTINPDGSIDVDGEFDNNVSFDPSRSSSTKLRYKPSKKNKLTELPIKFNKVDKIVLDRLEEVFHQLGMEIPENITFKNYEII